MSPEKSQCFGDVLRRDEDPGNPLSKWWIFFLCITLFYGFAVLLTVTGKAYEDKAPIPAQVVTTQGHVLFTGNEIRKGQEIFLQNGLMDNGTVWGHGAYLGPDFPALTLHRMGENQADIIAKANFGKLFDQLTESQQNEVEALVPVALKQNRYNAKTDTLVFNDAQTITFLNEPTLWAEYLSNPVNNGGLKANLITSPEQLKDLSAYFMWAAWASVAPRPGESYSYTNNFPFDPLVGNLPTTSAFIWSAVSLIFLLGGIGLVLFITGRNPAWEWHNSLNSLTPWTAPGNLSDSQKSLLKFVAVVALLFLTQTLVGGGVAHFRADPGNFYGFDLSKLFPSSLLRTWHLQLSIFWIATGFVAGGLFLSRVLGGIEVAGQKLLTNLLFVAFAIVIFGSLLTEWGGLCGLWDSWSFWLGSQGWEYLELGRLWQILLIAGLFIWVFLLVRNVKPALQRPSTKALTIMFLIAATAIPFFYIPAVFYDSQTHYTVVDTWRFWIIHLWVEGFFELFATTMVALLFIELGLVTKKVGLRIIYLDGILIFMGGIIGCGHHWYFTGQSNFNLVVSSCFSALECVPLVILCAEAWPFIRTANNCEQSSGVNKFRWPLMFVMSVGFWNFVGAGVFGFLINMPIVSYFEVGTYLTPNHGHSAMFGVFGLLSLSLCCFIIREANTDENWVKIEKYIRLAFWGLNVGLALMLILSLLPNGFMQLWDVLANGYWHARSVSFTNHGAMSFAGYMRMPADLIFIFLGAVPFLIAAIKTWRANLNKK